MSRGLGEVEREVLSALREMAEPWIGLTNFRERLCPSPDCSTLEAIFAYQRSYERSRHESINRAVRSLSRKGYVRSGRMEQSHLKVIWLADRPKPAEGTDGVWLSVVHDCHNT
jgi:hypothetical protein